MALYTEHQVGPRMQKHFQDPSLQGIRSRRAQPLLAASFSAFLGHDVFFTENVLNRTGPPRTITKERQRTGTAAAAELGFALWRTTFTPRHQAAAATFNHRFCALSVKPADEQSSNGASFRGMTLIFMCCLFL